MCAIYAIQNPVFQPAMRIISAITNANPAVVTTTFDNNYNSGEIVRLNIPVGFGMQQANQLTGAITVINTTSFYIDIDTTLMDPFVDPGGKQQAQVTNVGEINAIITSAERNVLPYPAS